MIHKRRRRISTSLKMEIVRKYLAGEDRKQLATQYNVGYSSIYNWAKNESLTTPRYGLVRMPSVTKTNIVNYVLSGRSIIEASNKYQLSRDEVKRIIEEYKDGTDATTPTEFPVVSTESDIDKVLRIMEALVDNNVDVRTASKVVKQLM